MKHANKNSELTGEKATARYWARQMSELNKVKRHSIAKRFGSRGPSPEQLAEHKEYERQWSRAYRLASKLQKALLAKENASYHSASARGHRSRTVSNVRRVHKRSGSAAKYCPKCRGPHRMRHGKAAR